jgi:ABC-type transport system involved in multi-copper enzyme maturation permease subunit
VIAGLAIAILLVVVFPNLRNVPLYLAAVILTPLLVGLGVGLAGSGLWRSLPRAATLGVSTALVAAFALDAVFFASPLFFTGPTAADSAPDFAHPTVSSAPLQATPSMTASSLPARSGTFDARPGVDTVAGTAVLGTTTDARTVLRLQQLNAANGPDLYVYLTTVSSPHTRSQVEGGYQVGRLKATQGDSNYVLPDDIDASKYLAVVIYCRSFSAIFGYANLS